MKLKRIASLTVALAMSVQLLTVSAFAADDTEALTPGMTTTVMAGTEEKPAEVVEEQKTSDEGEETVIEGEETFIEGEKADAEDEEPLNMDEAATFGSMLPEGFTEADLALLEADPAALSFADQLKQQEVAAALNAAMGISMMTFGAPDYTIATADDLKAFADAVNGGNTFNGITVKLTADIDLSSVCSATVGSWTPIGLDDNSRFEGTFDGQNHTVSNLYINTTDKWNVGLFGDCYGTIKNLGVVDADITASRDGSNWVGIIAGKLHTFEENDNPSDDTAHLDSCYATGKVEVTASHSNYVGGLVGHAVQGTIKNSYSTATVTATSGQNNVGGVVGWLEDATIDTCYSTGAVSGSSVVGSATGGIAGSARKTYVKPSVTNCVALNPSVSGANDSLGKAQTGAVVGYYFSTTNATVSGNSYWGGMTVKKAGTAVDKKDQSGSTALTYDANASKLKAGATDFTWSAFPDANWENKTASTVPTLKTIPGQSSLLPAHIKPRVTVTITDLDLTDLLAVPVKAGAPQTTVTDTQYTGTIAWSPTATGFAGETVYTATVTLTPKEGYKLEGLAANAFTHTGATGVSNAANSGVVTLVFPATAARTLTDIAVKTAPTKTDYTHGDSIDPAGLVLDLTFDDGTDTVAYTAANAADFTFAPAPLTKGTTAATVTYGGKSTSITGLTVGQKTLTWDVSGLSAKKPYDGTTAATVNGTLKVSGVLPGEDAGLTYDAPLTGTYDNATPGTGKTVTFTAANAAVTNTNYTLPTDDVVITNGRILGNMINLPPEEGSLEQLAISVEDGVNEVPNALKDKENLNTPAKIITALQVAGNKQLPGGTCAIKDLELWSKPDGTTSWVRATEKFPAEGVKVDLPYSDVGLTYEKAQGMDFTVAQMLTKAGAAGAIGDIVATNFTLTSKGISFTLLSPAPVVLGFKAKPATKHGSGEEPASPTPAPDTTSGKFTVNAWVNVLAGGVVSPMGNTTYTQGKNVTYTITPSAGYRVARVTVDGVDVGAVTTYTFSYLNRNHVIGAYFEKTTGQTTATAGGLIPQTADDAPLMQWFVLVVLAALGLTATVTLRRKNRK